MYLLLNEELQFNSPKLALEDVTPSIDGYDETSADKVLAFVIPSPIQTFYGSKAASFIQKAGSEVYLKVVEILAKTFMKLLAYKILVLFQVQL